jgi:hypothetical protein
MDEIKYPLVMVTWGDACSSDKWQEMGDVDGKALSVTTVGFVVKKGPEVLVLMSTIDANGSVCGEMSIPLGMVTRVRPLSFKKGGKRK